MGSKSSTPAPDPGSSAAAQAAFNMDAALDQASLNRITEITPLGTVRYVNEFDQPEYAKKLAEFNAARDTVYDKYGLTPQGNLKALVPGGGGESSYFHTWYTNQQKELARRELEESALRAPEERDYIARSRITELTPKAQEAFENQQQLTADLSRIAKDQSGRVENALAEPFSFEGLPEAPRIDEAARNRIEDALYQRQTNRLNPEFDQGRLDLETRLNNQGIQRGTELFDREFERFGRTRNDAYENARLNAISAAGAEQSRLFGLGSAAREQALKERVFGRQLPINETTALLSGAQVQIPDFGPTHPVGVAAPDYLGAQRLATQVNMGNQQAKNALNQQIAGGLFSLASGGLTGGLALAGSNAIAGSLRGNTLSSMLMDGTQV